MLSLPKVDGIEPCREGLAPMERSSRDDNAVISDGIVPTKSLDPISRTASPVRRDNSLGILDDILLLNKERCAAINGRNREQCGHAKWNELHLLGF